jgi:Tol biopolymer transport system component
MSLDGRYVAFSSTATNLAAADTTSVEDVYLHDRTTGATTLVSISLDSTGSNQPSVTPALSADGTHIAFTSSATRLIATDTNNVADVFVRDLTANTTKRVSTKVNGGQATFASLPRPRISGDGHYVVLSANGAFDAPATTNAGTFLVDTTALGVTRMSDTTGPFDVDNAVRYVLFGDPSSWSNILDRVVNTVTELGAASDGALAANGTCSAIAWQGRINARCGTTTASVIVGPDGAEVVADVLRRPALSADGRWIVFATNVWSGEEGHYVIVRVWNRAHTP